MSMAFNVTGQPKTASGKRWVSFPSFFFDMLKQHQIRQLELRDSARKWEDNDLVFLIWVVAIFILTTWVRNLESSWTKEAQLPDIHFHNLRHSVATILLSMGLNVKVIQELLGHTDISITLGVYGHLLPSMQQSVVDTWDGVFKDDEIDSDKDGKKGRKRRK